MSTFVSIHCLTNSLKAFSPHMIGSGGSISAYFDFFLSSLFLSRGFERVSIVATKDFLLPFYVTVASSPYNVGITPPMS